MRSTALIVATLLLLAGALLVYFQFQPEPPARSFTTGPAIGPASRPLRGSAAVVGSSSEPWVRYDKETGELASQFRAARADPQPDGTVLVEKPQAEFILDEGRVLRIAGARGSVIMPPPEVDDRNIMNTRVQQQTPSRGHLYDVVLSLFASLAEADTGSPMLTLEMHNAMFDNDTFRISTESYTDDAGRTVAADQVAVKVRGDDYDFDGRGLTIRWDQVGRRLQLLEIAHGESLTLKGAGGTLVPAADAGANDAPISRRRPAKRVPAPAPAATKPADRGAYRATFEKEIRILRAGAEAVTGNAMLVDFLLEQNDRAPLTQPSAEPATSPARRRTRRDGNTTTKPAFDGPIVIGWTGKLRVTPLEDEAGRVAPQPGSARVEITGAPVRLSHEGASAACGTLGYRSVDERVSLDATSAVPLVTMAHPQGWKLSTKHLDYAERDESVVLRGESRADIPDRDAPDAHLVASWNDVGTLRLVKDASGETTIENADLHGDVSVQHPRIDLTGGSLQLAFERAAATTNAAIAKPASTRPAIQPKRLVATGGVKATLKDPNRPPQSIAGNTLEIDTATTVDGKVYPRTIKADGQVVAADAEESIATDHLLARLRPATQPADAAAKDDVAIELESLIARANVKLKGRDGASADADQLTVGDRDGQRVAELTGEPAKLSDGTNTLAGPIVRMLPDSGRGEVVGAGALHARQPDKDGRASTPIDLMWAGGANFDGKDNLVRFRDTIVVVTADPDGTKTKAQANELRMTLADAPATQPSKVASTNSSRGGFALGGNGANFMASKVPKGAALIGDVRVESVLAGNGGEVLRRTFLQASEASYDLDRQRLDVPVAGRMLFEDHRPRDPKNKGDDNDTRGATAFAWKKGLIYDGAARLATMEGTVEINHDPDGDTEPFRMYTERVKAELEPRAANDENAPATKPAGGFGDGVRVRRVAADGGVRVESAQIRFRAADLTYDPASGIVIARGTEHDPITVTDARGSAEGAVQELRWNIRTDELKLTKFRANIR